MNLLDKALIQQALLEDLSQGDLTVDNLPGLSQQNCQAALRIRQSGVVSGLAIAKACFESVDEDETVQFEISQPDGSQVSAGTLLAMIHGNTASLLKAERTALNFMQHLSGIATTTRSFVDAFSDLSQQGFPAKILHTRKTTPLLRAFERQAVLDGGGALHRYNLGSAVMLKDNHLKQISISEAVRQLRERIPHCATIEVEVDHLAQIEEVIQAKADSILLDNMTPEQVREAVRMIDGRLITEASGNISLETIRDYVLTGVQYISTSKITLGAPAMDIGLDFI